MRIFDKSELKKLYKPAVKSSGEDNGQITIIGGSDLFHGAPILALKTASRIVDMVFFASPGPSVGAIAENAKSKLLSFIWVPWDEVEAYIAKSDAILIGPGFKRFKSEHMPHGVRLHVCDEECKKTREITRRLLFKFKTKRWVIDAGSLQSMDAGWIPENAIITPNKKEFQLLFGSRLQVANSMHNNSLSTNYMLQATSEMAKRYKCIIVLKGPETIVCSPTDCVLVKGGNPGMTKGGTGDVLAGLTLALLAKNDSFLAAASASYVIKAAADDLYNKVGVNYNADDLADKIPETLAKHLAQN
ncbi:NAD(P)H-hydrate dehydratase [Candidatus Woesebacteria bacterium RIFCSPHIGHO2_01_FULL_37_10]|uniref:ADP-dependent (S)-NAD(P)H-hydrate dehydratase n=1 Tax=Candidatus Woesebacteria bacterium RIFCSPHIGHO2_01_FULL_37_10 TaxID=1802489 RepID=A0A1F7XWU8_9BACT|nr:MAG: NAD(P)H-hydrate dehydratase [Candidatus Woesebacteria bacterium RIFCSPHIGHO2_01_FULL_37_10]